jgi:hypothetical protein
MLFGTLQPVCLVFQWRLRTMTIFVTLPCWTAAMSDPSSDDIRSAILELISRHGSVGWHEIAKALRAKTHRARAAIYRELKRLERAGEIRREIVKGAVRFHVAKPDGDGEKT